MSRIKELGNTLLRTPETFEKYHNNPRRVGDVCFICHAPALREFSFFKMIENEFPYDAVAEEHTMLVPYRHFGLGEDMNMEELADLTAIKKSLDMVGKTDCIIENLAAGRTVKNHYHLHLIKWKRV